MSEKPKCIVREARDAEEAAALCWPMTLNLGWDRAEADMLTHYISSGKDGWFVVAPAQDAENAVGNVVAFNFPNKTGWIGFFQIQAPSRGHGWGAALFKASLNFFKSQNADYVGLDAVQEQVKTYERRGFVDVATIAAYTREGANKVPLDGDFEHPRNMEKLVPLERIPPKILAQSDLQHTGLHRERMWSHEAMFSRDDVRGFALVKEEGPEELEGWVLVRSCESGYRVGPLYANSPDRAELLLRAVVTRLEDRSCNLSAEIWPQNPEAVAVFEKVGWKHSGLEYRRMWLDGEIPQAQQPGGTADKQAYAMFDAAEG